MNGQKTAAKWLVIILLVSISIFSYAMYDSFFVSDSGNVKGEDTSGQDEKPLPPPEDETKPPKIVYSKLPRQALVLGNTTIQHTGGSDEEELIATHTLGATTIMILKTASNSFDYKAENHLALALFDDAELKSTLVFSQKDEVFLDSKTTSNGIVILTKTANGVCKLRQYSTAIISLGEATLDLDGKTLDCAKFYLDGTSLLLFGLTDSYLVCKSVSRSLTVDDICLPYNLVDYSDIISIQKVNNNFVLALNSKSELDSAIILSMTAKSGFNLEKTVTSEQAISLGVGVEESVPYFILTTKTQAGVHLQKLSATFSTLYAITLNGIESAVVSQSQNGYIAVTPKSIYYLCKHLDSFYIHDLKQSDLGEEFDLVKSILYFGGKHYVMFYSLQTHKASIVQISDFSANIMYSFGAENSRITLNISTSSLRVFFTTALRSEIFASNFGGKDVFFVTIDTSAK